MNRWDTETRGRRDDVKINASGLWVKFKVTAVAVGVLGLGLFVLYAAIFGSGNSTSGTVVGGIIGGGFTLLGLSLCLMVPILWSKRGAIVGDSGFQWSDPRDGFAFTVSWNDVSAISVSTAVKSHFRAPSSTLVHVNIELADESQVDRQPGLHRLRDRSGGRGYLRLPLGPNRKMIEPLDRALTKFAREKYHGVATEQPAGPLTFS